MPNQFFSAENKNEIRLHSLGEIRWIYVGLEPSKVWPILKEYLESDDLKLGIIDPNKGIMESKTFDYLGKLSKFEDKAIVFEDEEDGEIKIKVMIGFPRAWAAVERSIKIAGLDLIDKNREEGKFYLSIKGDSSFFRRNDSDQIIQVRINKIEENISIISVFMENKDLETSREIISQINQALT